MLYSIANTDRFCAVSKCILKTTSSDELNKRRLSHPSSAIKMVFNNKLPISIRG